ncbi:MAG: SdpI family protein [Bacteroidota bacterium]
MDLIWGNLLIGGLIAILGRYLLQFPDSSDANSGYKTPFASKNKDTKVEANKYSGKMMLVVGLASIFLGILLNLLLLRSDFTEDKLEALNIASFPITSLILALIIIITTERHLYKTFDKNGNRRIKP